MSVVKVHGRDFRTLNFTALTFESEILDVSLAILASFFTAMSKKSINHVASTSLPPLPHTPVESNKIHEILLLLKSPDSVISLMKRFREAGQREASAKGNSALACVNHDFKFWSREIFISGFLTSLT